MPQIILYQIMLSHKSGEYVEIKIDSLAFGGNGVGRTDDGLVVFVEDGLPGQLVSARLGKVKKNYAYATLAEVRRQSPDFCEPRCLYFGSCGGCRLQHLSYDVQISAKGEQVRDALARIGGFADPPVENIIPSPSVYGYRNKMEYSFGNVRWLDALEMEQLENVPNRDFALGLHPRRRWNRIINIQECHLPSRLSVDIVKLVQESTSKSSYRPYTTKTHTGFWKFLIVREGVRTRQWLVDLVTSDKPEARGEVDSLARKIKAAHPEVTTITHTINRSKAAVATGDEAHVLIGPGFIEEEIGDVRFQISPRAFFQTNTEGADLLYREVITLAALDGNEVVYDLYCGTGTITLLMARKAGRAVGFEVVPSAVSDARINADLNGLENVEFVEGDVLELMKEGAGWGKPDVVVLNPPRAGLHPDVRSLVTDLGASRIVYVSCNPTTLAADLSVICMDHYRLEIVQPLDMFPHTPHVECVALVVAI